MLRTRGRRRHNNNLAPKIIYRVNHQIRAPQVVVIDENGENLGALPIFKAITLATEKELDLVEVFPKGEPPVCKILDNGQFQYQMARKSQEARSNLKKVEIKGVRISYKIGRHDLEMRLAQAIKFLTKGDKVKIEMIVRGREKQYAQDAQLKVAEFIKQLEQQIAVNIEQPAKRQGGQIAAIVAPKNK